MIRICLCKEPLPKTKPGQHLSTCPHSPWKQRKELKIPMTQPKKSMEEIQNIIDGVRFRDRIFNLMVKGDGFLVQMSYFEADVNQINFPPVVQTTRKWYISPYSTDSEIVETCFAMVCRSQLHVAGEHFTYHGRQVYSPHFNVVKRMEMCDRGEFDGRIPK